MAQRKKAMAASSKTPPKVTKRLHAVAGGNTHVQSLPTAVQLVFAHDNVRLGTGTAVVASLLFGKNSGVQRPMSEQAPVTSTGRSQSTRTDCSPTVAGLNWLQASSPGAGGGVGAGVGVPGAGV